MKPRTMLLLAPLVLLVGATSLLVAAVRLVQRALAAGLPAWHLGWIIPLAILGGIIKARFVMRRSMQANVRRLATATGKLRLWQIYPPQLLLFIATMILSMIVLKRIFAEDALALGLLGGVDLAVAVALVVASWEYRQPVSVG